MEISESCREFWLKTKDISQEKSCSFTNGGILDLNFFLFDRIQNKSLNLLLRIYFTYTSTISLIPVSLLCRIFVDFEYLTHSYCIPCKTSSNKIYDF